MLIRVLRSFFALALVLAGISIVSAPALAQRGPVITQVQITGGTLQAAINEGVRRGYQDHFLRASVARDAWGKAVRLHGFSARSGRLVRGLYHLEQPRDTDGMVIVRYRRVP